MAQLREMLHASGRVVLEDLPTSGLAYLLARAAFRSPLLVVAPSDDRAEQLVGDLRSFGVKDVAFFPAEPHVPFDAAAPDPEITFAQSVIRHRILTGSRPAVIVMPATGLQLRWPPAQAFLQYTLAWRTDTEVPQEEVADLLLRAGYNRVSFVEDPGTFAIRGSIVDVFPPGREYPVRLDFFGDEITSIKSFDPQTQRTFNPVSEIYLHPVREVVFDDAAVERAVARLDQLAEELTIPTRRMREYAEQIEQRNYFYGIEALWPLFYNGGEAALDTLVGPETVVVLDESDQLRRITEERDQEAERERETAIEDRHALALPVPDLVEPSAAVWTRLQSCSRVETLRLADDRAEQPVRLPFRDWRDLARELELRRKDTRRGEILEPVAEAIREQLALRHDVFVTCSTRGNAERLHELLANRSLDLPRQANLPPVHTFGKARRHPRMGIVEASLSSGFVDPDAGVAFLTDVELFGTPPRRVRKRKQKAPPEGLTTLRDLREGDHVIHVDHGIGLYLGLKRLVLNGVDGDYVHLEYQGGDKLYLPIYRLNLLQRYQGPPDVKVDKLGGTRWERTKQRVKDAVLAVAHSLLAVQARRKAQPGFRMRDPDDHFRAFEATFIHEETEDQRRAILDVISDLTAGSPMDRLICGDVGFGKTEVAVRAAFLSVLSGYQVVILVPTTVLAEQHGLRFKERLSGEPVVVDVLSRFRSKKEAQELLKRTAAGEIDILIGTHRLLSADVSFKNLGLLIVDEEQRFGVKHKERIKELRSQIHVLTLSATPIPRTMHMAMVGLRDISLIRTPPTERTPIRTEVTLFSESLVQEAIRRELHRGGQVFVVHNRVQSIGQIADMVKEQVPEARVAVAHGQMTGPQLEKIMVDFVRRNTDVLVSTAIIESGIDIPSANTMIVNRADMFGLAQLHQLRGRIGRGRERAYAYLLLPRSERITKEAADRLAVLKRFSDLGAGFHIASQDLDIRGAGDLLGQDQSGNMAAVGVELYTELLNEAIELAKGQRARNEIEPDIKLSVSAVIPESYVQQPMLRLEYYQRMANADSDEKIFDIAAEIEEVYGEAPPEVSHLAEVMVIRRRLKHMGASSLSGAIKDSEIRLGVGFLPDAPIDRSQLAVMMQSEPRRYKMLPSGRLQITVPTLPDTEPVHFLRRVRKELGELPLTE